LYTIQLIDITGQKSISKKYNANDLKTKYPDVNKSKMLCVFTYNV